MAEGMSKYAVHGVPVNDLYGVWDDAWPYLEKAIARFPNVPLPFDEGTVLKKLFARDMQLWIGWDIDQAHVAGALVTEIIKNAQHPGKLFMSIPLVGADDWNAWGDELWNMLKAWGIENGCTHALGYGRRGWTRLYGFVDCGTTDGGLPMFVRTLKR
jgi:hypothetical protein